MRSNYSADQVRAIIENYEELKAARDTDSRGMRALIAIADLDRALERIPWDFWETLLLHGMLHVPQTTTADALHVSQQAVSKRYRKGLDEAHYLINGGE